MSNDLNIQSESQDYSWESLFGQSSSLSSESSPADIQETAVIAEVEEEAGYLDQMADIGSAAIQWGATLSKPQVLSTLWSYRPTTQGLRQALSPVIESRPVQALQHGAEAFMSAETGEGIQAVGESLAEDFQEYAPQIETATEYLDSAYQNISFSPVADLAHYYSQLPQTIYNSVLGNEDFISVGDEEVPHPYQLSRAYEPSTINQSRAVIQQPIQIRSSSENSTLSLEEIETIMDFQNQMESMSQDTNEQVPVSNQYSNQSNASSVSAQSFMVETEASEESIELTIEIDNAISTTNESIESDAVAPEGAVIIAQQPIESNSTTVATTQSPSYVATQNEPALLEELPASNTGISLTEIEGWNDLTNSLNWFVSPQVQTAPLDSSKSEQVLAERIPTLSTSTGTQTVLLSDRIDNEFSSSLVSTTPNQLDKPGTKTPQEASLNFDHPLKGEMSTWGSAISAGGSIILSQLNNPQAPSIDPLRLYNDRIVILAGVTMASQPQKGWALESLDGELVGDALSQVYHIVSESGSTESDTHQQGQSEEIVIEDVAQTESKGSPSSVEDHLATDDRIWEIPSADVVIS